MPERDPLLRLAVRLAHGRAIDWDEEERTAVTEDEREGIRKLRLVAALSLLSRAVMSEGGKEDLSISISRARNLAQSATTLATGSRWGQLEILERVGGGSFGEVYRARDPRLEREVALKILMHDASDPSSEVVREARLLAAVRHPNVVMVHGADRIAEQVGIWTEFLHGQTLEQIVRERGVLDGREAALIGIDLCRALSAVHAAGIIHQDVKLSNVMRAEGGRIVLMDFGLGREAEPIRPSEGSQRKLSGTPLFMAPEVLRGERPDARSDLYSLGVVLFCLVTGSLPVEASTLETLRAKHAREERRHARDLRPDLSEAFVHFLDRALSPDPRKRYQSAGEAERALLECLGVRLPDGAGAVAGAKSAARGGGPASGQARAVPHRLPGESDAFIGREAELAELAGRFRRGARLVTLQGPGGMGKTRLAIRYGWRNLEEWPGGAWFCDLTEARTKDGIASAVGEGLGVPLGAGDAVERLGHAIADRGPCLLILDNFEQVVERAAETVAPWLACAPEVRIVVTSRERLGLAGEDVQTVEALPLERGVELFLERARRQRPIEPDGPEAESVREVVRLVEGIPLAIELSAARVRVMTPSQIVDRIADRLRILAGSGTGRHATVRAAIDGSWELLKPWEKAAFAQCAVFEGGFGLDAAEGVLDLGAWPEAPWVVDVLQSLVDKSLLRSWVRDLPSTQPAAPPAMRFGMFVILQEYAREKLTEEGSIPAGGSGISAARAAERRHAQWFARFGLKDAVAGLARRGDVERLRDAVPELDNLVAAARRMAAQGDGETAAMCFGAACPILDLKGPLAVAVELGRQILQAPLAPGQRPRLLTSLGQIEQRSGQLGAARTHFEESLALDRESGYRRGEGKNLACLATLALYEGRIEEARSRFEAALLIHREVVDRPSEAQCLGNLGLALQAQGRLEEAGAHFEASLALHRELGGRSSEGIVLGNLADLRGEQGRIEEALARFQAALVIHREVGNRRFEGTELVNLGSLYRRMGRFEEARRHLEAGLAIHRNVGNRRFEGEALANLANLSFAQGRLDEARAGFHEALAIHREVRNRRSEGIVLGLLGALDLEEGRIAEARDLLTQGIDLLRSADCSIELAKLLCTRAELERRTGAAAAARATLADIESMVAEMAERPNPELESSLASLRQALSGT